MHFVNYYKAILQIKRNLLIMFRVTKYAILLIFCSNYCLLETTEAQTWIRINPIIEGGDSLIDMSNGIFINKNVGWFYASGTTEIFQTLNSGFKWTVTKYIMTGRPLQIFALDSAHVWILIYTRAKPITDPKIYSILHTDDGGANWDSSLIAQTSYGITKILFFNPQEGLAFNNHPWLTIDGGKTWTVLDTLSKLPLITDICFVNRNSGWAVGEGNPRATDRGFVAHTTDGGYSWTYQANTLTGPYPPLLYGVTFVSDSLGFAVGNNMNFVDGLILTTTDRGLNWTSKKLSGAGQLNDIEFIDRKNGWIAGVGGRIWSTTDGGMNWTLEYTGMKSELKKIVPIKNENRVYVFGESGTLLYKDLSTVDVKRFIDKPQYYFMHNSPNPFHQTTTITFTIMKKSNVQIKIYNVLGREIQTLVNDYFEEGTFTRTLDLDELQPGIYFSAMNTCCISLKTKMLKLGL